MTSIITLSCEEGAAAEGGGRPAKRSQPAGVGERSVTGPSGSAAHGAPSLTPLSLWPLVAPKVAAGCRPRVSAWGPSPATVPGVAMLRGVAGRSA
eukprot:5139233-Prorocentrum_lima.AAC.1